MLSCFKRVGSVMLRTFLALGALCASLLATAPAKAEAWRDAIAAGEKALAERKAPEAAVQFRRAIEAGAEGRLRVRAFHGLAGALIQAGDFAEAEKAVEAARAFIVATWGTEDLAMAANRQLHGVVRLRRHGDRDGARQAFAEAARIRNAKVDAWAEPDGPMGVVLHKQSGVKLPPRAGGLLMFRRDVNDDEGNDVAIGYRGAGRAGGVSVTLYVYRPEGEFRAIFDQEKRAITSFNTGAAAKGDAAHTIETPVGKIEGRLARFEYAGQGGIIGTRLYLFPLKRDYVKLRVTHRVEDAAAADEQVSALLLAIGWPAQ